MHETAQTEKCAWCGHARGNGDIAGCPENIVRRIPQEEVYAILFPGRGPQLVGHRPVKTLVYEGMGEHSYGARS